jgi:hypothetical protein
MLSPRVWVLSAPPDAIRLDSPVDAARLVREGRLTVCLPSYEGGRCTLELLGSDPMTIERLLASARKMPQWQRSYQLADLDDDGEIAPAFDRRIDSDFLNDLPGQLRALEQSMTVRGEGMFGADDETQGRIRWWLYGAQRKRDRIAGWLAAQQRGEHRCVLIEHCGATTYAVCLCGVGFEGRDFNPVEFALLPGHRSLSGASP